MKQSAHFRKELLYMNKVVIINVLVLLILIGGGGAAAYYYNQSVNYVSTDNARVDGQPVTIAATTTGQLTDWLGDVGKTFRAGDRVASVQPAGATAATGTTAPRVDITFPVAGTIVQQSAVAGSFVAAGTALARAYDFDHLWVTANIDETRINDIKQGQTVDVNIDAFPGTTLTGHIDKIGLATAATFSLLPTSNTNANYTKVTQVIPVTVALDGYKGLAIVPGMNVSVRVHI
jgi:multidrug resistance efflux pump